MIFFYDKAKLTFNFNKFNSQLDVDEIKMGIHCDSEFLILYENNSNYNKYSA